MDLDFRQRPPGHDKFGALGKNVNKSKQLVHFPNEDKIGRRKKIEYCACYPYTQYTLTHTIEYSQVFFLRLFV